MAAHGGGGVEEDQAGSSSLCPPAAEAEAAAAAAAIARAARPPRPGRDKRLGVRHPLKHRRFRAGGKAAVAAGAREVGEATTVAEATATGPPKGSDEDDEARYICGGWKRSSNLQLGLMLFRLLIGTDLSFARLPSIVDNICSCIQACCDDGRMSCGYSSFRGRRANMEDFYDIKSSKVDDNQINLFGIFDGETYRKTDSDFLDAETNINREDGSTASTAIFVGNHIYVANVGDSRTVMSKAGKAIALSSDHKPNRKDERKRIENAGGVVTWSGTWRVGGVLAMSRAFGNRFLKRFVVAEPEVQEQEIDDDLEFLILASDGLWDVVSNEHAVAFVKAEEGPEAAARKLAEIAFARGSTDNITCIVVKFLHAKMAVDSASSGERS
uniref:protein-serine/threonine phosphatase n=2 Tax=Oryza TaxID=4527 RepID=A0A0E0FPM0_ORYNI